MGKVSEKTVTPCANVTPRVVLLGLVGFAVSLYALHVEHSMAANPFYEPSCVTKWGSCAAVFSSSYAHLLSHWGLVERKSALDLSLASMGAANYFVFAMFPLWPFPAHTKAKMLLGISFASCIFSIYLLYVLKYVLKDFCVVCTTFHAVNFSMWFYAALPNFAHHKRRKEPTPNKKAN